MLVIRVAMIIIIIKVVILCVLYHGLELERKHEWTANSTGLVAFPHAMSHATYLEVVFHVLYDYALMYMFI